MTARVSVDGERVGGRLTLTPPTAGGRRPSVVLVLERSHYQGEPGAQPARADVMDGDAPAAPLELGYGPLNGVRRDGRHQQVMPRAFNRFMISAE